MKQLSFVSSALVAVMLLQGCGNSSDNKEKGHKANKDGQGSNIPYLKKNHANYAQHGSSMTPAPTKDASKMSIDWTITASSQEAAKKLEDHLTFMENKLLADKTPRGWDSLFLMEAYMKYNAYYTTSVERSNKDIIVSKQAKTACAYKVISAHSDAVHGDFFAHGVIDIDYSSQAESILASSDCDEVRSDVERYIAKRKKTKH